MKQRIELACKILIYATFFVPLVVIPSSFIFPFIVPKILLLRSLVMLALGAYILLLAINYKEYKPKMTPLNVALLVFFLSFAISTFVGIDPYHSFWDNHERMLGLFTIFHYIAFYYICGALFKNWSEWRAALRTFLVAGSGVMFVGLLQVGNPDLLLNQGSSRVASTLGNPIYVGGYGLFLTFVALLLIMKEKDTFWKWLEGALGILGIMGLFFSGTRGTMLGFVVSIGVMILLYAIALRGYPKVRRTLWIIAAGGLLVLGLLYAYRKTNFVLNIPSVGRAINTSLSDVEATPRWVAWGIAIESWKERPIFGWGPNNFFYAFNEHYKARSLEFGYGETWFDNAHNIIVNTLAVQGAFGLLVYLSIFVLGVLSAITAYRRQETDVHLMVIGSGFLVAHLVQNITVFENPTSYLYFMFWLAMISRLTFFDRQTATSPADKNKIKPELAPDRQIGVGFITVLSAVVLLAIFIFNIQPARANMMTLNALRLLNQDPNLGAIAMKDALAFNSPHIDDIRSDIGRTAGQILAGNYQKIGKDRSTEIFELAYTNLQKNLVLHPRDIRNQLTLSQLAQTGYLIENKPQYVYEAEKFLTDALQYSPQRQQIKYSLSAIKLQIGKTQEAIRLLEETITEDPKIGESYWRLAYSYKMLGQDNKVREVLALAQQNGVIFNEQDNSIINQLLSSLPTTTPKKIK